MRKIYTYFNGDMSPVETFFGSASEKVKNKFMFQMTFMVNEKIPFREPYVKHFSIGKYKRLYEMRIKMGIEMVRIIFYEHQNEVVLLHAFYKKGKRDTEKALEYALKILDSICEETGRVVKDFRKELVL